MKKAGIIGGLGPQTTANFYMQIQSIAQEKRGGEGFQRPSLLIHSVPMPADKEAEFISQGLNKELIRDNLIASAKTLEKGGADFIVMPCNTLHMFQKDIEESISTPFISIIDATLREILNRSVAKIGLISTGLTSSRKLYSKPLKDAGIELIEVDSKQQKVLDEIVINLVNDRLNETDKDNFRKILDELMRRGSELIVLGCTDLHIVFDLLNLDIPHIDTMKVLAEVTAQKVYE